MGFVATSPDPSTQLMQLRKAESIGVLHDHDGSVGDVHPDFDHGRGHQEISAEKIIIATGTAATQDSGIPFDGESIFTSDDILRMEKIPKTIAVIGAGVIGCEYAAIYSTLGVRVTLIDKRPQLLPFIDGEITDALAYHLRQNRVAIRLGEEVSGLEHCSTGRGRQVKIHLAPQVLFPRDKDTGRTRKFASRAWFPALRILARFNFLRGTPFDLLGMTSHRRRERALIGEYGNTVGELITGLTPENYELAVEIARLPELIRGFDHLKERQIDDAKIRERELLAAFRLRAGSTYTGSQEVRS